MSDTVNIYEQASIVKLDFASRRGTLTTYDLRDLDLKDLDAMAKQVNAKLKQEQEESFIPVLNRPRKASYDELRLEILKDVITKKVAEDTARKQASENRAKLARLKELRASKEDEKFKEQTLEELDAQIAALSASA